MTAGQAADGGKGTAAGMVTAIIPLLLVGAAFALRTPLLNGPRFHPDEALFASFARSIAVWRDPLLAQAPVDKPPLLFYVQALAFPFLGPREMAARLPNLFASVLTVAVTYAAGLELARVDGLDSRAARWAGATAGLIVALAPLTVAMGATAFTDGLMVAWCMAAVLAAERKRPGRAGVWLGLGLATKYQALFFVPLVGGLLAVAGGEMRRIDWRRWMLGMLTPALVIVLWDLARGEGLSLMMAQARGYGTVRIASPGELWERLGAWLDLARLSSGGWAAVGLGAAGLVAWAGCRLFKKRGPTGRMMDLLAGWLLVYGLLHWGLTVQVWDRYLLPLAPVAGLFAGGLLARWPGAGLRRAGARWLFLALLAATMMPGAVRVAGGRLPLGGDHGLHDGIEQVAGFMDEYPYGTVLYDHWLSWELRYYLFDSKVYVSWFPDAATLTADLRAFGRSSPRFLIVPAWESADDLELAARSAGFVMAPIFQARRADGTISFQIFRLQGE